MLNGRKIIAVIPAYKTSRTIEKVIRAIPRPLVDEILVVDDGSADETATIARGLQATVIVHVKNSGYGAAQKTGYTEALARGADIAVMVHSDNQYDPTLLPTLAEPLTRGEADACFGSRMHRKSEALRGGMHWWRFLGNIGLTFLEECVLHLHLSEYHTGYRAYSRAVLETIPFLKNSDNYVFDTQMIAQLRAGRFRVTEVPIPTHYADDSCSPTFAKSVQYGFSTLGVLLQYILHAWHLQSAPEFLMQTSQERIMGRGEIAQ